ncbi:MAG: chemotaxis protein CheB [Hyphomonas sp.]
MPEREDLPRKNGRLPARHAAGETSANAAVPVVAIGASAGGLKAFIRFLEAVPEHAGMAFVLIQHLSPNHESMMAELLGARTHMIVRQIEDKMRIERDCVYVNPPGQDVALVGNTLSIIGHPRERAARLPFDYFLTSLALERGSRAMCVVLSGTGQDGTKGLKAVKHAGGFVIAQDPHDADAEGMPRSAIQTGDVDAVLSAAHIPFALINWNALSMDAAQADRPLSDDAPPDWLQQVIQVVFERTGADFRLYKPGTLVRRIARRMSLSAARSGQGSDYLKLLLTSPQECEALAADLLINVTRFFRDPQVFEFLETSVIPDLVRNHRLDRPLRVWVAGCSSGEEAWSLAMLLREAVDADGRGVRLQILASDIDPDAIATARAGIYPPAIAGDVSAERLARFFTPDERGFRVRDDLRAQAVFTVQNLLSDPPFARLDLISCRNVLIYLGPEAQSKIISLFHFALVAGGVLLLGTSETGGDIDGRFEVVSKSAKVYRHLGRARSIATEDPEAAFGLDAEGGRFMLDLEPAPDMRFADICRRQIARHYTPASVLVTREGVCLYFLGPVDLYLDVPQGSASLEILPMVPLSHRAALRKAILTVGPDLPLIQIDGVRASESGHRLGFTTDVRFVSDEAEELALVSFQPRAELAWPEDNAPGELNRDAIQLAEVSGLRAELDHTTHLLDRSLEAERKIRRESLRLNEEYQSTNEELVTSKEELQSLNEELTVLNSQLQEALERQRSTSDDLKNVLYSTNVATLFLDCDLCIRFFTPATKSVFGVIASDVGRPLSDLRPLAQDAHLMDDAVAVLNSAEVIEREVSTPEGGWFLRRVLPYHSQGGAIEGIVITYVNVLEQHKAVETLEAAIRQAEHASIVKTRFLASASHDLRQPLQTLTLIHGLLAREGIKPEAKHLIDRMEQAVGAMSGMLNTMLDINQIEEGIISFEIENIAISELLSNLYAEYKYHAQAKSLELRLAPSSAVIRTDRRLLEQMIRNLLTNAIRYTDSGRVLIGCRKRKDFLRIEIWDTGIGISEEELPNVFGEYHKIVHRGRSASEGLGLGLSIVQRLADMLGHRIHARSSPGRGSMFSIEVSLARAATSLTGKESALHAGRSEDSASPQKASILIAEDDPDLRQLLEILLQQDGHEVVAAPDVASAVQAAEQGERAPELLIADYNLPDGRSGLDLARQLKQGSAPDMQVIILTGDISTATESMIATEGFRRLRKPVHPEDLEAEIQQAIQRSRTVPADPATRTPAPAAGAQVIIVDDDRHFCESLAELLVASGLRVTSFASGESFLAELSALTVPEEPVCVLIDAYLGGISGFDVLSALRRARSPVAAIMITGNSDVRMAVQAVKAGALEFIEKPIDLPSLRLAIDQALASGRDSAAILARRNDAAQRLEKLTVREREVLDRVLSGQPNKNIAVDLGISQRTVENHRASVMTKTGCKTLPALVRLAVRAM